MRTPQLLLHDALLNNSYDFEALSKTLDKTLHSSFSYLYNLEKLCVEYEEFHRFTGNEITKEDHISDMYVDENYHAKFDVDYDIIKPDVREVYRRSKYYLRSIKFEDLVSNSDIFTKIPIIIIDNKVIWDYSINITKDGFSVNLPFSTPFVYKTDTDGHIIFALHNIQVLIVDNKYYKRIGNSSDIKINKTSILDGSKLKINKELIYKNNSDNESLPKSNEGTMMVTLHFPSERKITVIYPGDVIIDSIIKEDNTIEDIEFKEEIITIQKGYELGTELIPLTDEGDYYIADLTNNISEFLNNYSGNIYLSFIFINELIQHTFYNDSKISIRDNNNILAIFENGKNKNSSSIYDNLYNAPIPVENIMIFKKSVNGGGFYLQKNTDNVKLHYPNIYEISDTNIDNGDEYKLFYFYHPLEDYQFTVVNDFYFKFIKDKFDSYKNLEEIFMAILNNNMDFSGWTDKERTDFIKDYEKLMNYKYDKYIYGDMDFTTRYKKEHLDADDFDYKDSTFKEWVKYEPNSLHDYVLEQNKLGTSMHLYTKNIDLDSRVRLSADLECGKRKQLMVSFKNNDYSIAFINVSKRKDLSEALYYDNSGNYYAYDSLSKSYKVIGKISIYELNDLKKTKPEIFEDDVLQIGISYDCIKPSIDISYVDSNTLDFYRWESNSFIRFTETEIFDKPRYMFAISNAHELAKELLELRVFVDGIMVTDIYHERNMFVDYIYIPTDIVTHDSYIELEIFPSYSFKKPLYFNSLDSYEIINIVEPDEVIFPTIPDIYITEIDAEKGYPVSYSIKDFFDFTLITKDKTDAYYEIIDTPLELDVLSESDIDARVASGSLYPISVENTVEYIDIHNKFYKEKIDGTGIRKYQGYERNIHFYEWKQKGDKSTWSWTKYDISGQILEVGIPWEYVDINKLHKDASKLFISCSAALPEDNPINFVRFTMLKITPKSDKVCNKRLTFNLTKNAKGMPIKIDSKGYPYIELSSKEFKFNDDYIRVFYNGRLLPKSKYDFYYTMYSPRIVIYEWMKPGDYVFLDVTPYRYKEIYYNEEIEVDENNDTLIDLRGYINKPFDVRYYDVYMNGRKLSINNVFTISPYQIALKNLHSKNHLTIYERERDWEWYGLDYTNNIYAFNLSELLSASYASEEDVKKLIDDIIKKNADCTINPNEFTETKMEYNEDFTDNSDFFIFYYYELVPKESYNPDILQISSEVMIDNFMDVYYAYKTSSSENARNEEEKEYKSDFPDVLMLDPDKIIEGRDAYFDNKMGYYKYSEVEKCYVHFTADGEEDRDLNPNKSQSEIDVMVENGILKHGRMIMTYTIGHIDDDIPDEILQTDIGPVPTEPEY